ncbi:undecaprenyl-diphosphate phosphatase [Sphingomonas sp.]|jgi:undecaprenyl-diphosphatase|uniref:undecaprenyl-diphosphate phosphatase n=1 Tax=Sphingomonas sp. TaxID=28214 RepID=UPI002DF02AB2|nr:undecaprenyl-diphosphate phosphatase [Sphingomonas sp.]HEV2569161.1 undecaprenyl-diphosphate phosphatase [Sphingomonas sp.]
MPLLLTAILLGIVEGLTEFLPVSSTGHLILAAELLGYDAATWATFNVIIQLGAILAVIVLYWRTFWAVAVGLFGREPTSLRFIANLLLAFLPSAVLGLILIDRIEALLENAQVVAIALVLGGIAILVIEALVKQPSEEPGVAAVPWKKALGIGFIQCLSMIPGVSRSGATIMGALSLGVERRTAAEFSFFLAVPTMVGATTLSVFKHSNELASGRVDWGLIGVGFVVSFIVAILVIRWFVGIVSKHGFAPFAWYRIVAGSLAMIWLLAR